MSSKRSAARKKTSPKNKKNEEPPTKKQKGIDMSHIPASLLNEGYNEEEDEVTSTITISSKSLPDYLKCPVCKEMFVSPEMYFCGHTVCKLCSETKQCPICRQIDPRGTTTNFTLKDVIANQFPEIQKQRQKELDEILSQRMKLQQYTLSARYDILAQRYDDFMVSKRIVCSEDMIKHLTSTKFTKQTKLKGSVKESEAKYLIANKIRSATNQYPIGDYIMSCPNLVTFLTWMETESKKKKKKDYIDFAKWLPIAVFFTSRPHGNNDDTTKRIAALAELDIGTPMPIDEWKNQPSHWIKDVEIGDVKLAIQPHRCGCGLFHDHSDDSDSDMDSDDSDMW